MFGKIREVIFENKSTNKKQHCYEFELMSGTKRKMFSHERDDEQLKRVLDYIWGLGYVKKITYLGLKNSR